MIVIVYLFNFFYEWFLVWLVLFWRYWGRRVDVGELKVGKDWIYFFFRDIGISLVKEKVWRVMFNLGF